MYTLVHIWALDLPRIFPNQYKSTIPAEPKTSHDQQNACSRNSLILCFPSTKLQDFAMPKDKYDNIICQPRPSLSNQLLLETHKLPSSYYHDLVSDESPLQINLCLMIKSAWDGILQIFMEISPSSESSNM